MFSSGIYHYQFKIVTKSWFEPEPQPALPEYKNDENKSINHFFIPLFLNNASLLAAEENEQIRQDNQTEYEKQVKEVNDRNEKRLQELTFTEVWYTFVDPYATEVDERGSDDPFRSVGVLVIKNGKRRTNILLGI